MTTVTTHADFKIGLLDRVRGVRTVYVRCHPDRIDQAAENIRIAYGFQTAIAFLLRPDRTVERCVGWSNETGWVVDERI